jgi:glycosyltransferase involved in cell wall biosynthesis
MTAGAVAISERRLAEQPAATTEWHVLTGEYPPQEGGVADYTRLVARGLADAGDRVVVWAPPSSSSQATGDANVEVRRLPDCFGRRSLRTIAETLDRSAGVHRLLVQYVPHAFGWKGANLPFCLWLRGRRRDHVWIMFHEVAYPFEADAGLRPNALAVVNRVMATLVGRAAERAFVSIPAWQTGVEAVTRKGTPLAWLPVPNPIDVCGDRGRAEEISTRLAGRRSLVGHFGTFGRLIAPLVTDAILPLVDRTDCHVLLIGRGSQEACAAMSAAHPRLTGRVHATGALNSDDVSHHIRACTLMMQPYPDGISSRRTSAMAALAHAVPLVATEGRLSEAVWRESGAVALAPAGDSIAFAKAVASLVSDPARLRDLSRRGVELYETRFHIRHTIAALRASA